MTAQEIRRDLPGNGYMRIQQTGDSFRFTSTSYGLTQDEERVSPREAVEMMAVIVATFFDAERAGLPGAHDLVRVSLDFMEAAINQFPVLKLNCSAAIDEAVQAGGLH